MLTLKVSGELAVRIDFCDNIHRLAKPLVWPTIGLAGVAPVGTTGTGVSGDFTVADTLRSRAMSRRR